MKTQAIQGAKPLPNYTKGEELFNAITHIVGGGFGIIFTILALFLACQNPTVNNILSVIIYSFSIIVLYTMSALYHFLPKGGRAKKVFRIFDHCTIFLLIAGCYTPFCLISLWHLPIGKIVFCVEWGVAVLGITFNAIMLNNKVVKALSQVAYLVMGWMVVFALQPMLQNVPSVSLIWLLIGGICYTVGIIFYALGKRIRYMHSIWHLFVLMGSIFQFVSICYIL